MKKRIKINTIRFYNADVRTLWNNRKAIEKQLISDGKALEKGYRVQGTEGAEEK